MKNPRNFISLGLRLALVISLPLSFALSVPAQAEDAIIEEIIVTAQKREQNLQETPISVTAFTGRAIEDLGFRQSVDIQICF